MAQLDLDDLPPRVAKMLASLAPGEEVLLVQGGAVVARLAGADGAAKTVDPSVTPEQEMKEIMDHFNSMIHDHF